MSGIARRVRADLARASAGAHRLRPGDLLLIFLVWYGTVRFVLENLRTRQLDVLRHPDGPARARSSSSSAALVVAGHPAPARLPEDRDGGRARSDDGEVRRADGDDAASSTRTTTRPSSRPTATSDALATRPAVTRRTTTPTEPHPPPADAATAGSASRDGARRPHASRRRPSPPRGAAPGGPRLARPDARGARLGPVPPAPAARAVRPVRRVPVPDRDLGAGAAARRAATCSSPPPTAAGWTRSSSCTPCRSAPRGWFLGSGPSTFTARWREVLDPPARRAAARVARRRSASSSTSHRRGRCSRTVACSSRCPRGPCQRTAGPHRAVPDRRRAHRAPDRRAGRAARDRPGPRSCTSAGGWPRACCRPRIARTLLGDAWDGTLPEAGSREELALARTLSGALRGRPRSGRRGHPPGDRRSAGASAGRVASG